MQATTSYREVEVQLHSFLTSAIDLGRLSFTHQSLYAGVKNPSIYSIGGRVVRRASLEDFEGK
jgi:hypothetical protein